METKSDTDIRQAPHLVTELTSHLVGLLRSEIRLAGQEVSRNANKVAAGAIMMAFGALLALAALHALAAAAVIGLSLAGFSWLVASLIVGAGLLVIAAVIVWIGKSQISLATLAPEESLDRVKTDFDKLKGQINVS